MKKNWTLLMITTAGTLIATGCATNKTKATAAVPAPAVDYTAPVTVTGTDTFETAQAAVDHIVTGWNLGNTLDSTGNASSDLAAETSWGNPKTTKEMITAVKNAGFNAIRLPVTWQDHMNSKGNVRKVWMERVHQVVDYCISQDLYCIVNVHHDRWFCSDQNMYNKNVEKFHTLWTEIATEFRDYDEHLLFESTNETLDANMSWGGTSPENYEIINKWNQVFVNTVRSTGGNNYCRNLIPMTYAGSSDTQVMGAFTIPTDVVPNHIIVEVHNYDPQGFCWKEASWTKVTSVWSEAEYGSGLKSTFDRMKRYADSWQVPVLIGDWGSQKKILTGTTYNDEERGKHAKFFVGEAKKRGLKCFWWDCGDFALIDRKKTAAIHQPVIDGIMAGATE